MADIKKIKRRLGIEDDLQDQLLDDLIGDAESLFQLLTGADSVSMKYEPVIEQAVYKLYNRKGSEGISTETVDGYSVRYAYDLFSEYMGILKRDFNIDPDGYRQTGQVMYW